MKKVIKIAWFATPIEKNPDLQGLKIWDDNHSAYLNEMRYMNGRFKRLTEWVEVEFPLLEGEEDERN